MASPAKAWDELNRQFQDEKPSSGFFKWKEGTTAKDKCEAAYKIDKTGNDASKPTDDDLYKWCSIQGYKKSNASGK